MDADSERSAVAAAQAGDGEAFARLVDRHRRELRAHCYRMAGSMAEADDLLQESLIRAWRGLPGFEGRASLKSWLYRVATNTCIDVLASRAGRTLPRWLEEPTRDPRGPIAQRPEVLWLEPCSDELASAHAPSPEAAISARQSVALAFLVALQTLPARQRAVLILRDVVGMEATEVAEALDMSVAAANSALQRARETTGRARGEMALADRGLGERERATLARYVRAWETGDARALVAVLREDATIAMPPYAAWYQGAEAVGTLFEAQILPMVPGRRLFVVPTSLNGGPAVAVYARHPETGAMLPVALQVLTIDGDRVAAIDAFLDPSLPGRLGISPPA
jgi:RNA polymerase sigma-70 factor (ECF subfamily)